MVRRLPTTSEKETRKVPVKKECPRLCIRCVLNTDHGANYSGHRGFRPGEKETTESPIAFDRKATQSAPKQEEVFSPAKEPSLYGLDLLKAFLITDTDDNGVPIKTCTLNLFVSGCEWKVCLHDRHYARSAWAEGRTWRLALEALNAKLTDGTVVWKQAFRGKE